MLLSLLSSKPLYLTSSTWHFHPKSHRLPKFNLLKTECFSLPFGLSVLSIVFLILPTSFFRSESWDYFSSSLFPTLWNFKSWSGPANDFFNTSQIFTFLMLAFLPPAASVFKLVSWQQFWHLYIPFASTPNSFLWQQLFPFLPSLPPFSSLPFDDNFSCVFLI